MSELILGGDGASWTTLKGSLLPFKYFQLNRFHIKSVLRTALGPDNDNVKTAYSEACEGEADKFNEILLEAKNASSSEKKKQLREARRYLARNNDGLADWRRGRNTSKDAGGMGTIETNVDKILANRVKKKGMSWSYEGADNIAKVIQLRVNDELSIWAREHTGRKVQHELLRPAVMKARNRIQRDPENWLAAHIPATEGPHSDRFWVSILRELSRIQKVA